MASSITGESMYAEEVYAVTPAIASSKIFPCRNPIYPRSMAITWNGLKMPSYSYQVQGQKCVLNSDIPLLPGDEIICFYTIDGD